MDSARRSSPSCFLAAVLLGQALAEATPARPRWIENVPDGNPMHLTGEHFWTIPFGQGQPLMIWSVESSFKEPPFILHADLTQNSSVSTSDAAELFVSHFSPPVFSVFSVDFHGPGLKSELSYSPGLPPNLFTQHTNTPKSFWGWDDGINGDDDDVVTTTLSRLDRSTGTIESWSITPSFRDGVMSVDPTDSHLAILTRRLGSDPYTEPEADPSLAVFDLRSRELVRLIDLPAQHPTTRPLVRNGVVAMIPIETEVYLPIPDRGIQLHAVEGNAGGFIPLTAESEPAERMTVVPTLQGFWLVRSGENGSMVRHVTLGGDQLHAIDFTGELPVGSQVIRGNSDRYLALRNNPDGPIALFDRLAPPQLHILPAEATETDGFADVTVRLQSPSEDTVRCRILSAGATAEEGSDYEALDEELIFPPGTTERTTRITILQDDIPELHESFSLRLAGCEGAVWDQEPSSVVIKAGGVVLKPRLETLDVPAGFNPAGSIHPQELPVFAASDFHISRLRDSSSPQVIHLGVFDNLGNRFQTMLERPSSGFETGVWWSGPERISRFTSQGRYLSWSRGTGQLIDDIPWSGLPAGRPGLPNILVRNGDTSRLLFGNAEEGVFEVDAITGVRRILAAEEEFSALTPEFSQSADKSLHLGFSGETCWILGWMEPEVSTGTARAELQLRSYDATTLALRAKRTLEVFEFPESPSSAYSAPVVEIIECGSHVMVSGVCYNSVSLEPRWSKSILRARLSEVAGFDIVWITAAAAGSHFLVNASTNTLNPDPLTWLVDPETMALLEQLDSRIPLPVPPQNDSDAVSFGRELAWHGSVQTGPWTPPRPGILQLSLERLVPAVEATVSPTVAPHGLTLSWNVLEAFSEPTRIAWRVLESDHADFINPPGGNNPQVPLYFPEPVGKVPLTSPAGSTDIRMHPNSRNWPDGFKLEIEWKVESQGQSSRPVPLASPVVEPGGGAPKTLYSHHPADISGQAGGIEIGGPWLAVLYPEASVSGGAEGRVDIFERAGGTFVRSLSRPPTGIWEGFGETARIHGDRILVGSPSNGQNGIIDPKAGEVFLFDIPSGNLLRTFSNTLGAPGYGASLAVNDRYICIGAPGVDPDISLQAPPQRGGFEVFSWSDFRSLWKRTTPGEKLGASLAFRGDDLYAGASFASPVIGGQKFPFVGSVHRFDISRRVQVESLPPPIPTYLARFGAHLQISGGRLAAEPRLFLQFEDQTWYQLLLPENPLPYFKTPPVLTAGLMSSRNSGKLEIFDFTSGRIRIGGPDDFHRHVTLSEDGWVYWSGLHQAFGMKMAFVEGFHSWAEMTDDGQPDFDEYLAQAGATFSLTLDPSSRDDLLKGLVPRIEAPNDAEAVIEKSSDLRSWSPAFLRDVSGDWSEVDQVSPPPSLSEFYRLRMRLDPLFTPPDEP